MVPRRAAPIPEIASRGGTEGSVREDDGGCQALDIRRRDLRYGYAVSFAGRSNTTLKIAPAMMAPRTGAAIDTQTWLSASEPP